MGTAISSLSTGGKSLYDSLVSLFGNVRVTSTQRDNTKGQHKTGDAIDFNIPGVSNGTAAQIIANSGMSYGQLINEISGPASSGTHLHISTGTKDQNLVYENGKYKPVTMFDKALDQLRQGEQSALKWFGMSDTASKVMTDPGATPSAAIDAMTGGLFSRGTAVVIGVVIIGLAIAALLLTSDAGQSAIKKGIAL